MSTLYSKWGHNAQLQTTDWTQSMYTNPAAPAGMAPFEWVDDAALGGKALRITMKDQWAADPLNGKVFIGPSFAGESEFYVRLKMRFPQGMPLIDKPWFQFAEIYGMPFGNSPTIGLGFSSYYTKTVNQWVLGVDAKHGWGLLWRGPKLTWGVHYLDIHVVMSEDPQRGLVELWLDDKPQRFNPNDNTTNVNLSNGTTTANYATITDTNAQGPQRLIIDQYVGKGLLQQPYSFNHGSPTFATDRASLTVH